MNLDDSPIIDNTITANVAGGNGGGVHFEHSLAQLTLIRSLISGNSANGVDEVLRTADVGPYTTDSRIILRRRLTRRYMVLPSRLRVRSTYLVPRRQAPFLLCGLA